jgi:hypothetical protein
LKSIQIGVHVFFFSLLLDRFNLYIFLILKTFTQVY